MPQVMRTKWWSSMMMHQIYFPKHPQNRSSFKNKCIFFVSESQVTKCGFARVRCSFGMAGHFLAAKRMGESIFGSTQREREGKKPIGTRCKPDRQTELLWQPWNMWPDTAQTWLAAAPLAASGLGLPQTAGRCCFQNAQLCQPKMAVIKIPWLHLRVTKGINWLPTPWISLAISS